jgi:hypothetical protein
LAPRLLSLLASLLAAVDGGVPAPEPVAASAALPGAPPVEPAASAPRLPAQAFAIDRKPRPRRTQAWTHDRRGSYPAWESDFPEFHFSRFLSLARPQLHPPQEPAPTPSQARIALFRFASAVIADFTQAIDLACPKGRCAPMVDEARQLLTGFVRSGPRDFTQTDRTARRDSFNHWYGWRLQSGSTSFELGCMDVSESPEVICELELGLASGLVLTYAPKTAAAVSGPDITIRRQGDDQVLGEIAFDRTFSGAPVVILSGSAAR